MSQRIPFVVAALITSVLLAPSAVEAAPRKAKAATVVQTPATASASFDRIRADSLDPAGDYRGYPDWARAAFGPRRGGGGGR